MKKIFCVLISGLLWMSLQAQTERVFVLTDRSAYLSGERVWCSLFCLDENGRLSLRSAVAYVELVSAEGTAEEVKIGLLGGRGSGEFTLPVQLPSGNYRLVAYTAFEGGEYAQSGSRLLSVYNPFSVARIKNGVTLAQAPSLPVEELQEGIEISVPRKVRPGRRFTALVKGMASDVALSVYHADGLEQVSGISLRTWMKETFPASGSGKEEWEYDGEVVHGKVYGAPRGSIAILSSAGSPEDTYFAIVNEKESVKFATGNIYGNYEMVCAAPDAGDNVRIRLESPFVHPKVENIPSLYLHDSQYSALVNRKNALSVLYGADTLYTFLPRREDLLLSGISWDHYHLDDYTRFPSIQEIIVELLPTVRLRNGKIELVVSDGTGLIRRFKDNILVMMDGVVIPDMNLLMNLDAMLLDDIYVCTEPFVAGHILYNGIVNFVSKKGYVKAMNFPENVYVLDFKGVRYPVAYPGTVPEGNDVRQLLYWHPGLKIKDEETHRIPLVSPAYSGRFCVMAEGLSATGEPVKAVTWFEVE